MSFIEVTVDERVAEVRFDRPEKLNAMNGELLDGFTAALRELDSDGSVSCVLLHGAGRAFSVGYDVGSEGVEDETGASKTTHEDWAHLRRNVERWIDVWDLSKPVLCAVHGYCMGGATMLAACSDVTVVAEDAVIGWPSLPLGGGLLSPVSSWLIGPKKAKELSFIAGSSLSGTEAVGLGWANHAVPEGEVLDTARELASRIVRTPLELLQIKKRALNRIMDVRGFRESVYFGAEWDAIAHSSASMEPIVEKVREVGLKEAIAWFEAGGTLK